MVWCSNCGKRSPPEMDEVINEYNGEYFCSDECRNVKRGREPQFDSY